MSATRCAIGLAAATLAWAVLQAEGQGSLTPPGAPAPMMKTLTQVEPRTMITNAPYSITQPGSYYLATNLTSTGHGIVIYTNDVVVDLMGFAIVGDRTTSDYGIYVRGTNTVPIHGVVVRNGTIRNFGCGIRANGCHGGRFERLALTEHSQAGIWLYGTYGGCNGNAVFDCAIARNALDGINLYGWKGACDGNAVRDCTVVGNGDAGIRLYGYGDLATPSRCAGNVVSGCAVFGNATNGIVLDGSYNGRCEGNVVEECVVAGNGGYGVYLHGNASGKCQGNVVRDSSVIGNNNMGILVSGSPAGTCDGNAIENCQIRGNVDRGIHLVLTRGNRVENNHVSGQSGSGDTYGISCITTSSNLFLRNSGVGQTYNLVVGTDTWGPIVTNQGELAATGKPCHPAANFSR